LISDLTSFAISAQGSKSAQTSSKAPANAASKPAAYRPPQAKGSANVQEKV
jgi:translation initiation factor 2A